MVSNTLLSWDIGTRYELLELLSKGYFSSVALGRDLVSSELIAVKQLKRANSSQGASKRSMREIKIMKRLDHPNIVKLHRVMRSARMRMDSSVYIVMEYLETDLSKIFNSPSYLKRKQIKEIFYQLICGVRYIHSASVLHRDIKPSNILLDSSLKLKICDFGMSRTLKEPAFIKLDYSTDASSEEDLPNLRPKMTRRLSMHVVTRWYRAPEVILLEENYSYPVDVWSLGCVFGELMQMNRKNRPDYRDRSPLFGGDSCYPLSPDMTVRYEDGDLRFTDTDQLNMITQILGTPSESDLSFLTSSEALDYLSKLPIKRAKEFEQIFPGSNSEELSILKSMLCFNPNSRIALEELIKHPYFDEVRCEDMEIVYSEPDELVNLGTESALDMNKVLRSSTIP